MVTSFHSLEDMQSLLNSGVSKVAATGAKTSKHGGATNHSSLSGQ